MKSIMKRIISLAIRNNIGWSLLNATVIPAAGFAVFERQRNSENQEKPVSLSPDLTVIHGPFKGMRYPESRSIGSSFTPKILGSYERELHPILEKICITDYSEIVDIGCAEGYYAVGLAMRLPKTTVFAYDTDRDAIRFCKKMAEINNVADRLITGANCDTNTLLAIPLTKKALILSDCEGYERELFTENIVAALKGHDFLIEIHDFVDIEISSVIRRRFQNTHFISVIESIDDIKKAQIYEYCELEDFTLEHRRRLLAEYRPHIMEWFFMTPRPV